MDQAGIRVVIAGAALLGLSACAPQRVSVDLAEQICLGAARDATGPHGTVGLGVGSGGRRGGFVSVGMSSDYIFNRDPSEVYARCVVQRSGQMPRRPLYAQPGWVPRPMRP